MKIVELAAAAFLVLATMHQPANAQQPVIQPQEWAQYKTKFMDPSGRIIDNGNGGISHSEGQGYGMWLAYLAGNRADFEQIWYFTRTELLLRDDGLAVWKWDPKADPHVTDTNNATDGDLLIAYSLALAGSAWQKMEYLEAAARIANAILVRTVIVSGGRTLLLPAAEGFGPGERPDGPVVNPSYWIFEALPVMKLLAPSGKWDELKGEGIALLKSFQSGISGLPPEWASVQRQPKPANGFEPQFSYNAVRIPLYLLRGGIEDAILLKRLKDGMTRENGMVSIVDLSTGKLIEPFRDPGYQIVNHIMACVLDKTGLPQGAQQFEPVQYYPATLKLLSLAFVREKHPTCL